MLAPVSEAEFGERALLELGLRSAAPFEAFCAELAEVSGRDPGLRRRARSSSRATPTRRRRSSALIAFRESLGLRGQAAAAEPGAPRASPRWRRRCGWRSTSPATTRSTRARLVAALREAVERAGGELRARPRVVATARA